MELQIQAKIKEKIHYSKIQFSEDDMWLVEINHLFVLDLIFLPRSAGCVFERDNRK